MGLSRSTFYDRSAVPLDEDELVRSIGAICDEFECYGYRRVGAALRHQGVIVNGKKLRRLLGDRADLGLFQCLCADTTTTGTVDAMPLWAGESVSGVRGIQSAAEIVLELAQGLEGSVRHTRTR